MLIYFSNFMSSLRRHLVNVQRQHDYKLLFFSGFGLAAAAAAGVRAGYQTVLPSPYG